LIIFYKSIQKFISITFHNLNLLQRKVIEFVDHLVNLPFQRRCVGIGDFLFGGEDLRVAVMQTEASSPLV
jgi:hypothetical protein